MSPINLIILILIVLILILGLVVFYLLFGQKFFDSKLASKRSQMKNIVSSQRQDLGSADKDRFEEAVRASQKKQVVSSELTLEKKLRYARWKIPPVAYWLLVGLISIIAVAITSQKFDKPIIIASLLTGPIVMNGFLTFFMDRRYKAFDKDYPSFLLNIVSMLRTGMNTMGAIEAAASGLEDTSLVREEANLMMERLRLGVSEDKSIGSFGEDIYHPEIELFVQALLLSRRVGGTLSDTLDRLSRQVRQRQHFRSSAKAAVGLQRGSIWVILGIMCGLEVYIYFTSPELIKGGFEDPTGWMIWQTAIIIILLGIYWIRQVTKLKI